MRWVPRRTRDNIPRWILKWWDAYNASWPATRLSGFIGAAGWARARVPIRLAGLGLGRCCSLARKSVLRTSQGLRAANVC